MDAQTNPALGHRPATAADLAQIIDFYQDPDELFFCHPQTPWPLDVAQLQSSITEGRDNTLVLLDGQAAGFANFQQWQHGRHCTLGNLIVAPWTRGRGVAQYLFEVMAQHARAHYQARLMTVSCLNTNSAALRLSLKLGFQVSGLMDRLDRQQQRVVLIQLQKQLRTSIASR